VERHCCSLRWCCRAARALHRLPNLRPPRSNSLHDPRLSLGRPKEPPGVYSTAVSQSNIESTIFVSGWTATVRPPTSYTQALKKRMLESQGLAWSEATKYELDHYVPLALGGDPRSVDNLWLEPWTGDWNARIKDRLERKLQVMVCAGRLTLKMARDAIRDDWKAAYRKYVSTSRWPPHEAWSRMTTTSRSSRTRGL
jgi:hypothetical protein